MWPWDLLGSESDEAIAAVWIGGIAALIAVWGIITQRAITRRQTTMDLASKLESDRDLIEARQRFVQLTRSPAKLVGLADEAPFKGNKKVDPDVEADIKAVRLVFNHLELLAIGIQYGSVDYGIIKRYMRSQVINDWASVAPLVFALRKKYDQAGMYHEVEELARWLRNNNMPRRRRLLSLWW